MDHDANARIATLVTIAERKAGLGRTALMKICYLLQTLGDVPLGYHFTLYSYGPFDSDVLADLASAEVLGAVSSRVVQYPNGYGYEINPSQNSQSVIDLAPEFLEKYGDSIDEVLNKFAGMSKNDLEVLSTVIYVDRESASVNEELSTDELTHRVHEIKRNFAEKFVTEKVTFLKEEGLLQATQ
jgi:uncharacterized protein YwgA